LTAEIDNYLPSPPAFNGVQNTNVNTGETL
jgi:hypothetical protein